MPIILDQNLPLPPVVHCTMSGSNPMPALVIPISTFPEPCALTSGRFLVIEFYIYAIDSTTLSSSGAARLVYWVVGGSPPSLPGTPPGNWTSIYDQGSCCPPIGQASTTGVLTITSAGDLEITPIQGGGYSSDTFDCIVEVTKLRIFGNA